MELSEIRKEIDGIDDELVRLFVRRLKAADAVAAAKGASGCAVRDPERERDVLAKAAQAAGPGFADDVQTLFETLLSVSRARQRGDLGLKEGE